MRLGERLQVDLGRRSRTLLRGARAEPDPAAAGGECDPARHPASAQPGTLTIRARTRRRLSGARGARQRARPVARVGRVRARASASPTRALRLQRLYGERQKFELVERRWPHRDRAHSARRAMTPRRAHRRRRAAGAATPAAAAAPGTRPRAAAALRRWTQRRGRHPRASSGPRVPRRADARDERLRSAGRSRRETHAGRDLRHRTRQVRAAGVRGPGAGLSIETVRRGAGSYGAGTRAPLPGRRPRGIRAAARGPVARHGAGARDPRACW